MNRIQDMDPKFILQVYDNKIHYVHMMRKVVVEATTPVLFFNLGRGYERRHSHHHVRP